MKSKIDQLVIEIDAEGREQEITVAQAILRSVRLGASYKVAATAAGVTETCLYNWKARGEEHQDSDDIPAGEERFVEFVEELTRARGACAVFNLALLRQAALNGEWRAAGWTLERCFPKEFGKRVEQDVTVTEKPAPLNLDALSDEEVAQLNDLLARAAT